MSQQTGETVEVRSEVREDGSLRLALETAQVPALGEDDVLVELKAAPLHPADIGLLLGPADLATATTSGHGQEKSTTIAMMPNRMAGLRTRIGKSLPVGNEGAGVVVQAGARFQHLIGKPVAVMGGGMVTRYRIVNAKNFLPIPDGVPIKSGAAVLINPLTAQAMIETMREQGHTALVHTAAASSLGQMLNRICREDGIELVNVVRRPEHVAMLKAQGATHVCDSSSPTFDDDLSAQISASGATLAFDAVGGGKLASQILSAMEQHALTHVDEYNRYGSRTHKQLYFYGGLDTRPSEITRSYGMSWSVGGWLIFEELQRMTSDRLEALRTRISDGMLTTFACDFAGELSMTQLMEPENLKAIAARSTGDKYLINPSLDLAA